MNAAEITDKLGLHSLRNRVWYIQVSLMETCHILHPLKVYTGFCEYVRVSIWKFMTGRAVYFAIQTLTYFRVDSR